MANETPESFSNSTAPWSAPSEIRAFILSGGSARRAGGLNKSLMRIDGRPIIEHQLESLRPIFGQRILVITDRPKDYEPWGLSCQGDPPLPEDCSGSSATERSSLRGIASALSLNPRGWCFLLAGDMPWPDPSIIRRQWHWIESAGHGIDPPVDGICLKLPSGPEPFHALYHGRLAPSAYASIGKGQLSVTAWINRTDSIHKAEPAAMGVEDLAAERCVANFNSPPGVHESLDSSSRNPHR